ncbi:MAG: hypothetical protein ACTSV5_12770 [Promethearchaeota archaeon]
MTSLNCFYSRNGGEDTIFGLRSLMFVFPTIALRIGIIAMYFFPITKSRFEEIKTQVNELHEQKRANF